MSSIVVEEENFLEMIYERKKKTVRNWKNRYLENCGKFITSFVWNKPIDRCAHFEKECSSSFKRSFKGTWLAAKKGIREVSIPGL